MSVAQLAHGKVPRSVSRAARKDVLFTGALITAGLVVLIAIWSAFKMLWIGPVSIVLLIRVRMREAAAARRYRREMADAAKHSTYVG